MIHWTKIFAIVILLSICSCTASFILIKKSDNVRVDNEIGGLDSLRLNSEVKLTPIKVKGGK